MGIKGLTKLLADIAPEAMKEQKFESYFGRKIAIDAGMSIYQFLIVVGRAEIEMLTNEAGEVTSHLQGMFTRTIKLLESGMKPVVRHAPLQSSFPKPPSVCDKRERCFEVMDEHALQDGAAKEEVKKFKLGRSSVGITSIPLCGYTLICLPVHSLIKLEIYSKYVQAFRERIDMSQHPETEENSTC